jgi:NAD(P)-dependent dehydrogenase (short-subunit alcohol dehydrogenase family)
LSANGARISIIDVDADNARLVGDECMAGGAPDALGFKGDVRDRNAIRAALSAAAEKMGPIDTFVYSAGILRTGRLATMSAADFDLVMDVNLKGFFTCVQEVLPHMSGSSLRKSIVAISSISALRPKVAGGAYAASKVGLQYLVRVLAVELGSGLTNQSQKITVAAMQMAEKKV